jgi:hypothetical protein
MGDRLEQVSNELRKKADREGRNSILFREKVAKIAK